VAQADTFTIPDSAGGGLQEYALLPADLAARIPDSVSLDEAATLPTIAMAAFVALFHPSGLGLPAPYSPREEIEAFGYAQRSLVVIGGGSNCGKVAIQMAALLAGFGTIVAVASKTPEGEAELRALGATHVVDRRGGLEAVVEQVRGIVGDGLVYALDTVGTEHTLGVSLLSNSEKGTLATLLPGSVDESKIVGGSKAAGYEVKFSRGSGVLHRELGQQFWKHLPGWLEEGRIRPLKRYRTISGLDEKAVNEALDGYRHGGSVTKVNVHPHGSAELR
jgi:NADPH2:quinone reductase